jgi:hypothetical protein
MEINPNLVHRWVNGNMVSMASPNDPVFWLHHANIDRLWGVCGVFGNILILPYIGIYLV